MAVLEKRVGLKLGECDAYVNVAGGIKLNEPAVDLGIVMAIVSSYRNIVIPQDIVVFGEVGLSGEVRSVSLAELRVQEAYKLGFKTCIVPKSVLGQIRNVNSDMKLLGAGTVREALDFM
jgi:DNA repair protein RadA/Sms